ncbi:MAG: C13 family peptidase [Dongiaceae bacterium]
MRQFRDLVANLWAGARMALFLPVRRHGFRPSVDQIVILAVLSTLLEIGHNYIVSGPSIELWGQGISVVFAFLIGSLLGVYAVARIQGATHTMTALLTYIMSVEPLIYLVDYAIRFALGYDAYAASTTASVIFTVGFFSWWVVVIYRAIRLEYIVRRYRAILLTGTQMVFVVLMTSFPSVESALYTLFYADGEYDMADFDARYDVDVEQAYYAQPALVDRATQFLQAERQGIVDLYFVGYAGYADQDVFMREVNAVAALFNSRFDTRDRAVTLINNPKTVDHVPLANRHNLELVLERVATKMYTDEDVLFLFLTSHGSPEILSTNFYPLGLNDLSPEDLRQVLDQSGIKWRVIVVSACYSGSFIEPLKDDNTLIMTAARHDRTSFGCGNENDFTYFGEAYFDQQLRREYSFVAAFENARRAIAERERTEKLTPSDPQIHIGSAIQTKLDELEQRLRGLGGTALAN